MVLSLISIPQFHLVSSITADTMWAQPWSIIEYEIIGEGSQISTNQKRESTVSWLLIGRNLRPFPDNFVLYSFLACGNDVVIVKLPPEKKH